MTTAARGAASLAAQQRQRRVGQRGTVPGRRCCRWDQLTSRRHAEGGRHTRTFMFIVSTRYAGIEKSAAGWRMACVIALMTGKLSVLLQPKPLAFATLQALLRTPLQALVVPSRHLRGARQLGQAARGTWLRRQAKRDAHLVRIQAHCALARLCASVRACARACNVILIDFTRGAFASRKTRRGQR